jgi:adenylosuccinate lyase
MDLHELDYRRDSMKFRGAKGTTGTQASFLALFHGDHDKVRKLDLLVAEKMGFDDVYAVTGQTYSRKVDSQILDALSGLGQSLHKWGTDLRLLAHRQEIDEPFETEQVGSSAMAYKRNPMRSERMCSLARFLMGLPAMAANTMATQWFERTLDDSAVRRLYLPQAFLAADGALRLALNIASGLVVNVPVIARGVAEALPYMATENLMMAAVAKGADRQEVHESIRRHSHAVTAGMKEGTMTSRDLITRLQSDPAFAGIDIAAQLQPIKYVGRSPEQVDEFIAQEVAPIRERYPGSDGQKADVSV